MFPSSSKNISRHPMCQQSDNNYKGHNSSSVKNTINNNINNDSINNSRTSYFHNDDINNQNFKKIFKQCFTFYVLR